jgi:hypothetical protein
MIGVVMGCNDPVEAIDPLRGEGWQEMGDPFPRAAGIDQESLS